MSDGVCLSVRTDGHMDKIDCRLPASRQPTQEAGNRLFAYLEAGGSCTFWMVASTMMFINKWRSGNNVEKWSRPTWSSHPRICLARQSKTKHFSQQCPCSRHQHLQDVTVATNRESLSVSSPAAVCRTDREMLTFWKGVRGPAGPRRRRKAVAGRSDIRTTIRSHVVSCRYNCQTGVYRARVIIMLAPEVAVTTLSLPVGANKNTTWYLGIRYVTQKSDQLTY